MISYCILLSSQFAFPVSQQLIPIVSSSGEIWQNGIKVGFKWMMGPLSQIVRIYFLPCSITDQEYDPPWLILTYMTHTTWDMTKLSKYSNSCRVKWAVGQEGERGQQDIFALYPLYILFLYGLNKLNSFQHSYRWCYCKKERESARGLNVRKKVSFKLYMVRTKSCAPSSK